MFIPAALIAMLLGAGAPPSDSGPRSAIELYFQAHALGNGNYIRQVFTPDAKIGFVENGHITQWTRDEFAANFERPAADEYRRVRRVESLDVEGTAASAIVTLDYGNALFRDHLSLLKIEGQWRIVSKVFSAEHRQPGQALQEVLRDWTLPFEPRRVIGNIYYVGSNMISSFLIVTPAGHILIDTGPVQMLPQVEANIEKIGFRAKDVKILLNSHAHIDHCGGFAEFKRQTDATIIVSKPDGELMMQGDRDDYGNNGSFDNGDRLDYEPIKPDRFIADGEQVELGGVTLSAHLTPGHTKGCTSWSMRAHEDGKNYDVLFLCGLTVSPFKLTNNDRYPNIVQDAQNSILKLRSMHVDVLLAAHAFWFDLGGKAARQHEGAPNPFVDPGELGRHLTEMEHDLDQALEAQEQQR
jgi:metallo-beta-lactamase class B